MMATSSNEQQAQWKSRRRLSLASNFGSRHDLYHTLFGRRQQVIACQLFFEDEAPTISQLKVIAQTLGERFERLRGIPTALEPNANDKNGTTRVFRDVNDWTAAVNIIVQDAPLEKDDEYHARLFLEQVKLKDILPTQDTVEVPLWRMYRVGNKSIVLCVDHCIGDGLSLASLLAVIATESEESSKTIQLEQVSPLFASITKLTWWERLWIQYAFLWPPKLLRCIKYMKKMVAASADPITPLMPISDRSKEIKKIPVHHYGTVYLCPLPVRLFKRLARAKGNHITVSDVLVSCVGDTVRRYLDLVGFETDSEAAVIHFGVPLAVPVKPPTHYLDESRGLNSLFIPTGYELPLAKSLSFSDLLNLMHNAFEYVKRSYITSLMTFMFRLMSFFIKPDNLVDGMKDGMGKATYVWSNVPGPTIPIDISGHKVSEIQCVVSNPFCMMQTCSYNGRVYTNIQVDTRSCSQSELLSKAYGECIRAAIEELLLPGAEQRDALRTLEEASTKHYPGPFLSSVHEDELGKMSSIDASLNIERQI